MSAITQTSDGDFAQRSLVAPTKVMRPFMNWPSKNLTTKLFERLYEIDRGSYVPFAALATLPAEAADDPADSSAYLLTEGEPELQEDGTQRVRCLFGHVPTDQVRYRSRAITKPAFPTADFNGAWSDSTSATGTANVWSAAISVGTVLRFGSGGTFTITYVANAGTGISSTTGALAWNASTATIKAALEGLASAIADGMTFSVTGSIAAGGITVNRAGGANFNDSQFTVSAAGLTPGTMLGSVTGGSNIAQLYFARASVTVPKVAHGLSAGQSIRYLSGTTGGGTLTTVESVIDADNFTLVNASAANPVNPTHYRTFLRTYTPGLARPKVRETWKFYLIGVGAISSIDDIPDPAVAINDTQLLNLITGGATGFQTYDAEPLANWPVADSPMYAQVLYALDVDSL